MKRETEIIEIGIFDGRKIEMEVVAYDHSMINEVFIDGTATSGAFDFEYRDLE